MAAWYGASLGSSYSGMTSSKFPDETSVSVASDIEWDYDRSVKPNESTQQKKTKSKSTIVIDKEPVSPTTFDRSVERVEEWLSKCSVDSERFLTPLKLRRRSVVEASAQILHTSSILTSETNPASMAYTASDGDETKRDSNQQEYRTPKRGHRRKYTKTPLGKIAPKTPGTNRKFLLNRKISGGASEDEVEGGALRTPRHGVQRISRVPKTPLKGLKTPGRVRTKTPAKKECSVKSIPHGMPHNPQAIGDLLFQLNLMEEALRTNPTSLGISSPHTARVLARQVGNRERELFGLLSSFVRRPRKLSEKFASIQSEEAALVAQRRKLFAAGDRKIDFLEHRTLPTKIANVVHRQKAQRLKSANQILELERLSTARAVRKVSRMNQEVSSEVRSNLATQLTEIREQLREEKAKDEHVVDDLIEKLDWARERYHDDLDCLIKKLNNELDINQIQKVDLRTELRKLRKRITAGIDMDFRWKAEKLEKGDRGQMIV